MALAEGQQLYWVPTRYDSDSPCFVTVIKAGRKWAQLSNHRRIDVKSLLEDTAYGSPSQCYLDKETYLAEVAKNVAWGRLQRWVSGRYANQLPDTVSIADIEAAGALLGQVTI